MKLDDALIQLARNPSASLDVAEVGLRLAQDEYSNLDVEAYLAELDAMAHEARRYMRGSLATRLHGLCRYLFHDMGFCGNVRDYYDPRNSYLNIVLDLRTGIPISLSAVVIAVGRRAGMEIHGVGLPGHFLTKAVAGAEEIIFDPFHGGRRLDLQDCEILVRQVTGMQFPVTTASVRAIPLGQMVQRMLNNLKAIYLGENDFARGVRVIERLLQLEPSNPQHLRDLGASLLQLEQSGPALDNLQAYLVAVPEAEDADQIQRLMHEAQRQIARWN
jgi:regulator of sirC expression with transglutaminase-like and TPR domain